MLPEWAGKQPTDRGRCGGRGCVGWGAARLGAARTLSPHRPALSPRPPATARACGGLLGVLAPPLSAGAQHCEVHPAASAHGLMALALDALAVLAPSPERTALASLVSRVLNRSK